MLNSGGNASNSKARKGTLAQGYPSPLLGFGKTGGTKGACPRKSRTLDSRGSDWNEKNADRNNPKPDM